MKTIWMGAVIAAASLWAQRIRPPEALNCSRDHLTAYTGKVTEYRRSGSEVRLRMATDDDTDERFAVRLAGGEEAGKWFLFQGEPFRPEHWKRIESRPGRLRAGMRATAWICEGSPNPVIDWRPPPEE